MHVQDSHFSAFPQKKTKTFGQYGPETIQIAIKQQAAVIVQNNVMTSAHKIHLWGSWGWGLKFEAHTCALQNW